VRAVVLRSVAVIGLGVLILGGVLYVASTVDGRAPEVAAITVTLPLPDDASRALITTSIEVEFSEPVEQASAAEALSIEPSVDGGISWSGSTMIFTPSNPLELATSYRVSVGGGIRDLAGNRMTRAAEPFVFETSGPPTVRLAQPKDGADDVGLAASITITFSSPMDTASVEAALMLRPAFAHELRWDGEVLEIIPVEPFEADQDYRLAIGDEAKDVAGVGLAAPLSLSFRTIAPGLETTLLIPADGTDGIAPTTSVAVVFDAPIDPSSVSADALSMVPDVAGTLALVDPTGEEPAEPADATVLRFSPSGPLPASTTFEVVLDSEVTNLDAGGLAAPIRWSFTTGPTLATLSNQIAFLSDRSGIGNLWVMNPDGSAARQVSSELTPVLDYAVAPDGTSFVVGDGRRLVLADASGADRQVLTPDGMLEFDPTYSPDGQRVAFARADAETADGLGLWERLVDGGTTDRIEIEADTGASTPVPSGSAGDEAVQWLRAPRYAPDGSAIAFIEVTGSIGILERETDAVRRVAYQVMAPPAWLPDGEAVLLTGQSADTASPGPTFDAPIAPLEPSGGSEIAILDRSGASFLDSGLGTSAAVAAIAADGRVAYVRADGELWIADDPAHAGSPAPGLEDERIEAASFAPGEEAMVVVVSDGQAGASRVRIERLMLPSGDRSILSNEGRMPRWLP
jgi:hypothetical protein